MAYFQLYPWNRNEYVNTQTPTLLTNAIGISTKSDLISWNGQDDAYLTNSLTLVNGDDSNYPVLIGKTDENVVFHGQRNTITLDNVQNWPGLFDPLDNSQNIKIKHTIIDWTNGSTLYTGAAIGTGSFITNIGSTNFNMIIENCAATGTFTTLSDGGGIVGRIVSNSGATVNLTIDGCYSTGTNEGGGICGEITGNDLEGNLLITNCYTTGNIEGGGGILHKYNTNMTSATISNCYTTGNISASYQGGQILYVSGYGMTNMTITNCYTSGQMLGNGNGAIVTYFGPNGTINISNCYSQYATGLGTGDKKYVYTSYGDSINITNCAAGNGSWSPTMVRLPIISV